MMRLSLSLALALIMAQPAQSQTASAAASDDPALVAARLRAELEAERAMAADSRADTAEARERQVKASVVGLDEFQTEGKVTLGTNAGQFEAALIASEVLREQAETVARRLCSTVPQAGCGGSATQGAAPAVLVYAAAAAPSFVEYDLFMLQGRLIGEELERALVMPDGGARGPGGGSPVGGASPSGGALPALPAVTGGLDLVGRLFRADYSVASVEVSLDQNIVIKQMAGRARKLGHRSEFHVPGLYTAASFQDRAGDVVATLVRLDELRRRSELLLAGRLGPEKTSALKAAVLRYDDFLKAQATAGANAPPPLVLAARQSGPARLLRGGGYLLLVRTDKAGGSTYTKRSFWTAFGSLPLYVSGGAISSFSMFDGATGRMLDGFALGRSGGFRRIRDVAR